MVKNAKKVETTSVDIEKNNLDKLRSVFPQFIKDNVIDFDALKAFFNKEKLTNEYEKYGLRWSGKQQAFDTIKIPSVGTLIPSKKESKNWDETENLMIEGDNLEVLKLLQNQYREKIKMIYIDPPYNTGKDFVYKDNFTKNKSDYYEKTGQSENGIKLTTNMESNGRYHSDWLTMMYPRLFLAKNLLKEDGVIFVSIDDNEVANLRSIMDEIFGEENFVGQITVVGNPRGRDYGGIARMHDYLLVYARSELLEINNLNEPNKIFPYEDKRGGFEIRELRNRNIAFNIGNRPNLYYPFYVNENKTDKNGFYEISLEKIENYFEVFPKESQGYKTVWRWGKPKSLENLNSEILAKKMEDGGYMIIEKYREKTKMARSVWAGKEDNTEKGTLLIKTLLNGKFFDFPKSMEMIRKIIEMGSSKDGVVLDFFAGSGTTGHAVMDLNAEDGGNRKYILVQIPESTDENSEAYKAGYKNIAEITKERLRRAGEKIGKGDIGFKVYKLSPSNYRQWNFPKSDEITPKEYLDQQKLFVEKPLVDKYSEENVAYEILLKEGFDLNSKLERKKIGEFDCWTTTEENRKLIINFNKEITLKQVELLKLTENDLFVCLDSALDDSTKTNINRNWNIKVI